MKRHKVNYANDAARILLRKRPFANDEKAFASWAMAVTLLANFLEESEPDFDRKRFYAACGFCNEGATK